MPCHFEHRVHRHGTLLCAYISVRKDTNTLSKVTADIQNEAKEGTCKSLELGCSHDAQVVVEDKEVLQQGTHDDADEHDDDAR